MIDSTPSRKNANPHATEQPSAKEILQARYARGEISREQYERKKQDIE
jgi:uncharacterized membrane protein